MKLLLVVALIIAANVFAEHVAGALQFEIRPSNEDAIHRTIMLSAGLYAVLLSIPFVPGVEIGLALIGMLGVRIVFLVYLCTLLGLVLSYVVGRLIPLDALARLTEALHLRSVARLLERMAPLTGHDRLRFLVQQAPGRFVPFLLRHRYLALAVAINVPGNYLIGGGGGIALFAGCSRLYSLPGFLVTIALAVAPVPLAVLFFGPEWLVK